MSKNGEEAMYDIPDFFGKGDPLCSKIDPDVFFPEPDSPSLHSAVRIAKEICNRCPYKTECLEWAVSRNEIGIWGGTTDIERRKIRRYGTR